MVMVIQFSDLLKKCNKELTLRDDTNTLSNQMSNLNQVYAIKHFLNKNPFQNILLNKKFKNSYNNKNFNKVSKCNIREKFHHFFTLL